jgi:hypothetical protein
VNILSGRSGFGGLGIQGAGRCVLGFGQSAIPSATPPASTASTITISATLTVTTASVATGLAVTAAIGAAASTALVTSAVLPNFASRSHNRAFSAFHRSGRSTFQLRTVCDGRGWSTLVHPEDFLLHSAHNGIVLVVVFEKVGDIEERVAFEANVHECGLHAGEDPGHTSFMDTAGEGILFFTLVEDFHKLVVFKNRDPRFVPCGRND